MSNRTANEKCRFLVGRVLPVYRQLTTFRAWKKWTYGILQMITFINEYTNSITTTN